MGFPEFKHMSAEVPRLAVAGDVYGILAAGADTGGAYALFEALVPPGGGPPPHVHQREDEGFYVLAGEVTFTVGDRRHLASAGAYLHAPRGVEHVFRNTGREPARMLVLVTPAGLEEFFQEVGAPLPRGATTAPPPTEAHLMKIMSLAPKYGLEIRAGS